MKTYINRSIKHALLVTMDDIRAIWDILSRNYGEIASFARCVDGSTLTFDSIDEIENFENPNFRRIEELVIAGGDNPNARCKVVFREKYSSTGSLLIEQDEDDKRAVGVAKEIENRFLECRPWYSPLTRVKPSTALIVSSVFVCSAVLWRQVLIDGESSLTSNLSILLMSYILAPFIAVAILIFSGLDRWGKWMFPKLWFLVGRQELALVRRTQVRNWVFGTLIFGVFLSVLANLISGKLAG